MRQVPQYKMVAPNIDNMLYNFERGYVNPARSTSKLKKAAEEISDILEPLAPSDKYGEVKQIWLRIPRGTIEDYLSPEGISKMKSERYRKKILKEWEEQYPDEYIWYKLIVSKILDANKNMKYYGIILGDSQYDKSIISISAGKRNEYDRTIDKYEEDLACKLCKIITPAIKASMELLKSNTYNEIVEKELPYQFRTGIIRRSEIWKKDEDFKKSDLDGLTEKQIQRFKELINTGENDKDKVGRIKKFCANKFFKACKLGYQAVGKKCNGYNLPDLYIRYSDGRDEGLTAKGNGLCSGSGINAKSSEEWDKWYFDKHRGGGHPWEVIPGGNSTHMSLFVYHDMLDLDFELNSKKITKEEYNEKSKKAGYYFLIEGTQRQFESVCFYLALSDAGLPVVLMQGDEILKRIEGTDYVGIVPHKTTPRYCESLFPVKYGEIIDFIHAETEDKWFKNIIWLPITDKAHIKE